MIKVLLFVLLFITISRNCFSQTVNRKFEIIGNISGFPDGTYIKLYDFSTGMNVFMDSCLITNGKFLFKGSMNNTYQSVGLMVQEDLKVFWIEGGVIHFNGQKGEFNKALIIGSAMQTEEDYLSALEQKDQKNEKQIDIAYIKSHPNSLISGYVLKVYSTTWGKDTSQLLYNGLSNKVKHSEFGKGVYEFITLAKNIKVGNMFIDFTLPDVAGKNISLSDYKNKYVLLDFWGSWCGPCREENANLVKTFSEFRDKGFDILSVSIETNKKDWSDAVKQDNITWECVSDLKGESNKAALIYGIHYYPANFLIAPNGTIIAQDLRGDALRNKLKEIIK